MQRSTERAYPTHWEADIVLRDGGTALIRPITPDDAGRLVSFYEQVSDESKYYRFFAPYPRLSDRDVRRFTHHDYVDRVGLAVTVGGEFIGTVRYDRIDGTGRPASAPADGAEVAFLVQDAHQGRGVASNLLEHIAACARERGVRRFTAEVLPANHKMIKVFTDFGYSQQRSFEDGSVHLNLDLEPTEKSLAVQRAREQRAEARSVRRLLAPGSIAVIGAGRNPGGTGRTVIDSLAAAGFTGRVHAVNRLLPAGVDRLGGVPAHRSVGEIEEPVDLAVLAVPADQVDPVLTECGERGVQGVIVFADRIDRADQRELVRKARSYGMRVIGPNAFGLINTSPDARLNATLSAETPGRGRIGLFTQSGAIGVALLSTLHRQGAGLSSFVSAGNRADVSGNDVLQYWDDDPDTDVVLMYLESIGNPRKFTRLVRRTALSKPVVVVKGARHSASAPPPGHAVPASRTPDATVSALLRQAGVLLVDTVTELVDTGVQLAFQPMPAGPRVAVLGNAESLCLLTYDACLAQGLRPSPPVNLTVAATPEDYRAALVQALADPETDAVVVTAIPWVTGRAAAELADALLDASHTADKPIAVAQLAIEGLDEELSSRRIPTYPAPERAVRALAEATRLAQWRSDAQQPGRVPEYDVDEGAAARLVAAALEDAAADRDTPADPAAGGRSVPLDPARTAELLAHYGIAVQPTRPAPDADSAVEAARELGYPVALKTTAPHLRHRADLGGVRLSLAGERELRRAWQELTGALGSADELRPVVQAMAPRGVDTVVHASFDPSIGTVLSFGLAGTPSELLGDLSYRLVPVTDREAGRLVGDLRSAPMLYGWRGSRPADVPALEELLLRVSVLLDDHPEIVALDLEPTVVASEGLTVLGAAVRLALPPATTDLGPRRLATH
ncbi:GNAT family N-acetyltransferase [Streptomyces sp. XM4193]|uniref:bifunctional acetate--CoA ligase family protein/GNAT family N-acetyltransferase n=1 Tax=Streptomyces sp. XM4193 TaxID=2929782 RepID=UPI001FF9AB32|nr:bifunctional GNAT family N-acetyltransferase/acetate--CoA ligase family protein [Streptomyces sp. XM4193]MCK1798700.1 GNAT family N-acetyltransferase [Streptomyces sp. XM4193]